MKCVLYKVYCVKKGFTLLEVVIVMAIVGILALVAYPSYRDTITRAHRSDGQSALLDLANRMEQFYSEHNTYQSAQIATGGDLDVLSQSTSSGKWYTLSISNATDTGYFLKAIPRGAQGTLDTHCQSLTFNHLGEKNIASGPNGAPTKTAEFCWG